MRLPRYARNDSKKLQKANKVEIKKAVEDREIPGAQTLFVESEDAKDDYQRMQEKKVEFYKELTHEAWGTEFAILDPDKNKIEFQQRT